MKITKKILTLYIIFLSGLRMTVVTGEAAIIRAASTSYFDVNSTVSSASDGDIVIVPPGNSIWERPLNIKRGISLIGAGQDSTIIVSNYTGEWLIEYTPTDWDGDWPFRISGFTFDFNMKCGGVYFHYRYGNINHTIQTKLIIDNNHFQNANTQVLFINGYFGVAYKNTITGTDFPIRFSAGASEDWWNNWEGVVFGKENSNFYFEDNTIECFEGIADCQYGNRYALRYNNIVATRHSGSYPLLDIHGNQGVASQMWSGFGAEIYGNNVSIAEGQLIDIRGGKAVIFCNSVEARVGSFLGIKIREEYCDELNPVAKQDAYPQHVNDTYIWINREGVSGEVRSGYITDNFCSQYLLRENQDFFNYNPLYNGTTEVGIGMGSVLPDTGQVGDGFWLTDQSYTNLTNYIGVNPVEPITGTLYKYTYDRSWVAYFTPLPYPHPLRRNFPPKNLRFIK